MGSIKGVPRGGGSTNERKFDHDIQASLFISSYDLKEKRLGNQGRGEGSNSKVPEKYATSRNNFSEVVSAKKEMCRSVFPNIPTWVPVLDL